MYNLLQLRVVGMWIKEIAIIAKIGTIVEVENPDKLTDKEIYELLLKAMKNGDVKVTDWDWWEQK